MDWHQLSNWSSVSRRGRFPVDCARVLINAASLGLVDTTSDEFLYCVAMPSRNHRGRPLVFTAVFLNREGVYPLLSDRRRHYWRPLSEIEREILSLWWSSYTIQHAARAEKLRLIHAYLRTSPPRTFVWFITKGVHVEISVRSCKIVRDMKWKAVLDRTKVIPFLDQAIQFWVLGPQRPFRPSDGLDPDDFYRFITEDPL